MINILSDNEDGEPNFFGYIFSYLVASWECLGLITNLYSSTFHPTVYPVALFKNPTLKFFSYLVFPVDSFPYDFLLMFQVTNAFSYLLKDIESHAYF